PVSVDSHRYRGTIKTYQLPNGKYFTINRLPLETYLAGIQEILPSWSPQTFRAQAIASRTYALYQILTQGQTKYWDVSADVSSQVYGGISSETAKARAAVAATRGQVLITSAGGRSGIFCAFFSACAGGASQDPAEAWGDMPVNTLTARRLVPEYEARCTKFSWPQIVINKTSISQAIQSWGERNSLAYLAGLGPIQSVTINKRNPASGRPTEIRLTDAAGHWALMRAEEFRLALIQDPARDYAAPFSSNCDILDAGTAIVLANGHGHGHGIGLSQWGAQGMALAGKSHQEILGYYYPNAGLKTAW
ncbi:MAG: SpoIID/LytB domain-containing protein, partial [Phycisphaerae bacterium]